ncbi:hypothetical protein AALA54_16290, partial [Oscillospiraceae bacterium 44-34]
WVAMLLLSPAPSSSRDKRRYKAVLYMGCFMINYPPSRNSPRTCDALSNKAIISQIQGLFNLFMLFSSLFFDFMYN